MPRLLLNPLLLALSVIGTANAYFLVGAENFITTERIDPIVNPGKVSGHAHSVIGGSNFRFTTNTAALRQSECTSMPIVQDKSNYWFPHLYFQWRNGSFTSVNGGAVIYYLYDKEPGRTTAFPDDFRMLSGNPTLRTYDPNDFGQQAITFLCLDFNGVSTKHNSLPNKNCPSGVRSQVNFPSCWDGKNTDSPDHKSHVAYLSEGADRGSCKDPKFPKTLPRIFLEVYWGTNEFDKVRSQAMEPSQPFVFSYGDRTGYGNHADFLMGWDKGVLQKVVDECHCNDFGDATCCANQGIFTLKKNQNCRITKSIDEQTTGTIPKLVGNNPVQPEGKPAVMYPDPNTPAIFSPVYAYTGDKAPAHGPVVSPPTGSQPQQGDSSPDTPPSTPTTKPTTPSGSASGSHPSNSGAPASGSGSGSGAPSNGGGSGSPSADPGHHLSPTCSKPSHPPKPKPKKHLKSLKAHHKRAMRLSRAHSDMI